jgi:hypothetical protein
MRRKTCVQLVVLVGLAVGLTTQLTGLSVTDRAKPAMGPRGLGPAAPTRFVPQTSVRALTPNTKIRVDGRINPQQVPDELAFRVYLKSMTLRGTPTTQNLRRRAAFLKALHLPMEDERRFVAAVDAIAPELTQVEHERKQLTPNDPAGVAKQSALKDREDRALDQALARLTGLLSPDGWSTFDGYVRGHVKSSIVVFQANHDVADHAAH